ncbi:hypothetical protein KDW19_08815 [Burkholderia cenocepacia]|uniref:hypothetical protein n=1 Tax=Burkholderia cepacia complex TaxID=87882 RepID=UPI000F5620C1|nr:MULTISPECIES: hypothetical protein [Burkholderia cepacia complex]ELW9447978.1 hypothetical protein [Burkholderia cenocepacia]MBR8482551.1 hypothetical protein [Burkholderia cenocepacia]MDN7502890.1 hypothetical protein [Burkholderia orbicola]RQU22801.1 hypothetical protein DF157_03905 [Burkholderia cenocepacia]RQV47586.1 hypothetical protein DF028_01150 [Burkholderia cenocepacia]
MLTACGGGDDGGAASTGSNASNNDTAGTPTVTSPATPAPGTSTQPSVQTACRPDGNFSYSGAASPVAASNGQLAVLVVPNLPSEWAKNRNMTAANVPATSLVQQGSGAFTTLASSAAATDCLGLDHGAVTEIQGVGSDVAIGRWNRAMDTDGNTYTDTQGVHYAVGTPLSLPATGGPLSCTQVIADTVASNNGDMSGALVSSSATLDPASRTLATLDLSIKLGNAQQVLTYTQVPLNGVLKTTGPATIQSIVVGHDATQPLVAVGYTVALPNTSGVGGVAVLSCH